MNENICVCLIVSETTWVRQEWVMVQTFQDTHEMLMPQFWCFAISVQCFFQFPHFVFFQSCVIPLIWFWRFCKQVLVDIRVQECCVYVDRNCDVFRLRIIVPVCRVSSQPASFSETTLTLLVKTSRAKNAPDIDCSLSRLTLISLVRLSHDLPNVFESFSSQLPQTF